MDGRAKRVFIDPIDFSASLIPGGKTRRPIDACITIGVLDLGKENNQTVTGIPRFIEFRHAGSIRMFRPVSHKNRSC